MLLSRARKSWNLVASWAMIIVKRVAAANEIAEWKRTAVVVRKLAEAQSVIIVIIAKMSARTNMNHDQGFNNDDSCGHWQNILKVPWPLTCNNFLIRHPKQKNYKLQIAPHSMVRRHDTFHISFSPAFLLLLRRHSFACRVERDFSFRVAIVAAPTQRLFMLVSFSFFPFNVTFVKL